MNETSTYDAKLTTVRQFSHSLSMERTLRADFNNGSVAPVHALKEVLRLWMSKRKSMSISTLPVECPSSCTLCQITTLMKPETSTERADQDDWGRFELTDDSVFLGYVIPFLSSGVSVLEAIASWPCQTDAVSNENGDRQFLPVCIRYRYTG
jgi:hypothetical protein